MQTKVKLTKRQLKEDKFTTFMLTAKDRVQENWQFYVIAFLALILVVVGTIYFINQGKTRQQEAALKFADAQAQYRNGNEDVAVLNVTQLISDYQGTKAAERALFWLAKYDLDKKNYADAQKYFEQFLKEVKGDKFRRAAALAGIAVALEDQSKFADAARKYVEAAEEYPDGPEAADYRYEAMRNFLTAGDETSARAQLDIIESQFSDSPVRNQAVELFAEKSSQQGT
ncbi:MAG: hypothetical protein D6800_14475 [Candidatus Zixiibacteriota bacterium]|nr:MAG: hypothetical protein D6800_14475 [candidate division Zixibacteria bacterium]